MSSTIAGFEHRQPTSEQPCRQHYFNIFNGSKMISTEIQIFFKNEGLFLKYSCHSRSQAHRDVLFCRIRVWHLSDFSVQLCWRAFARAWAIQKRNYAYYSFEFERNSLQFHQIHFVYNSGQFHDIRQRSADVLRILRNPHREFQGF